MRTLVLLTFSTALALAGAAQAQDFTAIGDRILSDPTYLPLQGQIYGQTDYGHAQTDGDLFDATGARTAATRDIVNTFGQTVAYGITNALSVRASLDYGFGPDRRFTPTGETSSYRDGFDNPSFGATWRLLDQNAHPVSFDIIGDWAPDTFPSRAVSPTRDGTIASGGPTADFGFALGRETRVFTIRGAFMDRYVGGASTLDPANGASSFTPSYCVPSLGLQTQTRFTPRLSANLGYGYNFQGRAVADQTGTGVPFTNRIGDNQAVNVSLNYHFVPNRLVGSLGYEHMFYDDRNEAFADPTADVLQSRSADTFSATLRYVFR